MSNYEKWLLHWKQPHRKTNNPTHKQQHFPNCNLTEPPMTWSRRTLEKVFSLQVMLDSTKLALQTTELSVWFLLSQCSYLTDATHMYLLQDQSTTNTPFNSGRSAQWITKWTTVIAGLLLFLISAVVSCTPHISKRLFKKHLTRSNCQKARFEFATSQWREKINNINNWKCSSSTGA